MTEKNPRRENIFDHSEAKPKDWMPAIGSEVNIKAIEDHISKHIGEPGEVFHEILSHLVHIDVHIVKPSRDFPFLLLVTSGMSDHPMTVPQGAEEFRYAELCMMLPPDWPIDKPEYFWPIKVLKTFARFPHEYDTFLTWEHSIGGAPEDPMLADGIDFNGLILIPPYELPHEFAVLQLPNGESIKFCQILLLYPEEMAYKRKKGFEALMDLFDKNEIGTMTDPDRPNIAPKRRFFGLF